MSIFGNFWGFFWNEINQKHLNTNFHFGAQHWCKLFSHSGEPLYHPGGGRGLGGQGKWPASGPPLKKIFFFPLELACFCAFCHAFCSFLLRGVAESGIKHTISTFWIRNSFTPLKVSLPKWPKIFGHDWFNPSFLSAQKTLKCLLKFFFKEMA